ncbi:MAG: alanine dehydrogenase [Candidatus Nitronauta litoralis]|uniref:Alanine dehydrogenase n=1 Tax=Candidatus Nitronauta litoralis TaxID=2705533 RepID=A0A7T0BXP5_9BACT|nr:MAG: alanine dehydrogenase [Candidatus Nitronauta litoralis]
MIVGIPKEIKLDEYRVSLTPAGAAELVQDGNTVLVEDGAGIGSGIENQDYEKVGAIIASQDDVFQKAEMIIKVKEPIPEEYDRLRENLLLYTYLHLAPAPDLTNALLQRKVSGLAYETVQSANGGLPLLVPMSEVAGRMSVNEGGKYLERETGGRGILLGGVPGVDPGHIVIIGGGVVGVNAAKMAVGTGAYVTLLDINLDRLRYIDDIFGGRVKTIMSTKLNLMEFLELADLVIGAVLVPGARAPRLIQREMLGHMKPGSVIVDVGIDQGGIMETSKPTTHSDPIYVVDGVVHYCVANMPGAVARTSTYALTNATLHYARELAGKGLNKALRDSQELRHGLNTFGGHITHPAVAEAMQREYLPVEKALF